MSGIPELPQPAAAAWTPASSPAPATPHVPALPAVPAVPAVAAVAAALATAPGSEPAPGRARLPAAPRLALFRLGNRLCGVAAAFCKQFVHLDAVTPVPLAPGYLLGVTQLRGHILPVLDASLLPGLPGMEPPEVPGAPNAPSVRPANGESGTPPDEPGTFTPDSAVAAGERGLPTSASGMLALVVTATGLDSALAALKVTEIVGFERPSFGAPAGPTPGDPGSAVSGEPGGAVPGEPDGTVPGEPGTAVADDPTTGAPAAVLASARPLWRGEEVAVLDVAAVLACLRSGAPPHLAARAEQPR